MRPKCSWLAKSNELFPNPLPLGERVRERANWNALQRQLLKNAVCQRGQKHGREDHTRKYLEVPSCFGHEPGRSCYRHAKVPVRSLLLMSEGSHVNGEPILHIRLHQSFVGLVDLLDGDHFDIGSNVVRAAKVQHLLGLRETADVRAGELLRPAMRPKATTLSGFGGTPTIVRLPSMPSSLI